LQLGSYEIADVAGEINFALIRIYHKNASPYSYTMKLIFSATQNGHALCESSVETFSNATTGQTTADWLGDVCFSFNPYTLRSEETYFVRLVLTGYTRNQDTLYLGVLSDWLSPIGTGNTAGARMALGVFA
jgi:hypothetical protein